MTMDTYSSVLSLSSKGLIKMKKLLLSFCMITCLLILSACVNSIEYPNEGIWISEAPHMQIDMHNYKGWMEIEGEKRDVTLRFLMGDTQFEVYYFYNYSSEECLFHGRASWDDEIMILRINDNSLLDLGVEQIELVRDR